MLAYIKLVQWKCNVLMVTCKFRKCADLVFQNIMLAENLFFFKALLGICLGHAGEAVSDLKTQAVFYIPVNCENAASLFFICKDIMRRLETFKIPITLPKEC